MSNNKRILRVYFVNLLNHTKRHSNDVAFFFHSSRCYRNCVEIIHFGVIEIGWNIDLNSDCVNIYLCWRKLSGRLKCFPHTSHEKAISGLLWVRSWIIRLYDFVNLRWQYLQTYSHFGRILRRKSSLSIFNTVNILELLFFLLLLLVNLTMNIPVFCCLFSWFLLSEISVFSLLPQMYCCFSSYLKNQNRWSAELSRIVMIFICSTRWDSAPFCKRIKCCFNGFLSFSLCCAQLTRLAFDNCSVVVCK